MAREKILLNYLRDTNFNNDPLQQIGTDIDFTNLNPGYSPLRTIATITGDVSYVKKFGTPSLVTEITSASLANLRATTGNIWTWEFRGAETNTLLATLTDEIGYATGSLVNYQASDFDNANDALNLTDDCVVVDTLGRCDLWCGGSLWTNTAGAGTAKLFNGTITGGALGVAKISPTPTYSWATFSGIADGLKTFKLPKTSSGDQLGGTITYYWKSAAYNYYITVGGGSTSDLIFTIDGSVYGGSVADANLIVNGAGETGQAGGASPNRSVFTQENTLSAAEQLRIDLVPGAGNTSALVDGDQINYNSLLCKVSAENISSGYLSFYVSLTTSTYYDSLLRYGGWRHTPSLNNSLRPYSTIDAARLGLGFSDYKIEILDSEYYNENVELTKSDMRLYASSNVSPTICKNIGATEYRTASQDYKNSNTVYWNENGNDSTGDGTWQFPYALGSVAFTNIGAKTNITYGGYNAGGVGNIQDDLTSILGITVEADSYYAPYLKNVGMGDAANLIGFKFSGGHVEGIAALITSNISASPIIIKECTFENYRQRAIYQSGATVTGDYDIQNCYFKNNFIGIDFYNITHTSLITTNITECIFENNSERDIRVDGEIIGSQIELNVSDCIFKNSSQSTPSESCIFIFCNGGLTLTGTQEFNTFYGGNRALYYRQFAGTLVLSNTFQKNIINGFLVGIVSDLSLTIITCNLYNNDTDSIVTGSLTNTTPVVGDTSFCDIISDEKKLGLNFDSVCLKADGSSKDLGANLLLIKISEVRTIINGIIIDGHNNYLIGIGRTGSTNYNGETDEYCNIKNFQGCAIDNYATAAVTTTINNCLIHNNGTGVNLVEETNTIKYNSIYLNSQAGVYFNNDSLIFSYNSLSGNKYGLNCGPLAQIISFINNISFNNSLYDIYTVNNFYASYSCLNVVFNVYLVSNCISDNPLFVDEINGNLMIKSLELGFVFNSPCIGISSDSLDIGAYSVDRYTVSDFFKKYELTYNPIELNPAISSKGLINTEGPNGGINLFGKEHKRIFSLNWGSEQLSSKEMRLTIALMTKLIQTKKNDYSKEQTRIRLHLRPITFLETGAAAVIDATEKTISDSSKSWIQDEFEGYWAGVKFLSGSGTGTINSTNKTLAVAGAAWTVNEWTGYYIFKNGYYYIISSNTADTLTLGDPESTLISEASIDWAIEKYFEIKFNTENTLILYDELNELISGSYDYYIDFIVVKVSKSEFTPIAAGIYDFENEELKTGYNLELEQE